MTEIRIFKTKIASSSAKGETPRNDMRCAEIALSTLGVLAMTLLGGCVLFFAGGCAVQKRTCPPLKSTTEATAVLKEYSAGLKPFKATGNCVMSYINEKGEKFAQSFPVRMWYLDNQKFCFYGDVMFDPKGVCFVVTGGRYWAYAKPLGVHIKGEIDAAGEDYFSNPALLVDFLQPVDSNYDKISISKNVMVYRNEQNGKQKKIFIDSCGKVVKKIEYFSHRDIKATESTEDTEIFKFDRDEKLVLVIDADEYKNVKGSEFTFPYKLMYKYFDNKKGSNQMEIKFDSVQNWQGKPEQIKALFTEPDANDFKKETK